MLKQDMQQHSLQLRMCVSFCFELLEQMFYSRLFELRQQFLDAMLEPFGHLVMLSQLLGRAEEQSVEERLSEALPCYWPAARRKFAGHNVRRAGRKVRHGGGESAMRK
ncbi:hypothetical protein D3C78_1114520 [compost metagenome]